MIFIKVSKIFNTGKTLEKAKKIKYSVFSNNVFYFAKEQHLVVVVTCIYYKQKGIQKKKRDSDYIFYNPHL